MTSPTRRSALTGAALAFVLVLALRLPAGAQESAVTPLLAQDLKGWTADRTRARVESGVVTVEQGAGWLRFDRVLSDFELTMDIRLASDDTRAGIFVRTWPTFDKQSGVPDNGYRVVASRSGGGVETVGRVVAHGRAGKELVYANDVVGPFLAAKDAWHRYEIMCTANRLKVSVDGRVVSEIAEMRNPQGYLAFRVDAGAIEIRNVQLKPLTTVPPADLPAGVVKAEPGLLPQVSREVKPQYTPEAMARLIQGTVWISAVVQRDGTTSDFTVIKSLDPEFGLDRMALAAAAGWQFRPALREGQPVPVLITLELQFILR